METSIFQSFMLPFKKAAADRNVAINVLRIISALAFGITMLFTAFTYVLDGLSCGPRGLNCQSTSVLAALIGNLFWILLGLAAILYAGIELYAFINRDSMSSNGDSIDV